LVRTQHLPPRATRGSDLRYRSEPLRASVAVSARHAGPTAVRLVKVRV
jgi:hypothetical protein